MDINHLSQRELNTRCAWCHKIIPTDDECFGAGAKLNAAGKRMVEGKEGTLVIFKTTVGHEIIVIVPTKNSKAHAEGHDIFFQTCSEACAAEVAAGLRS